MTQSIPAAGNEAAREGVSLLKDGEFLEEPRHQMHRFAAMQLSDNHLADDAVQEALIGALKNVKSFGFATVWGSGTLSYRQALALATFATVAGGLASLFLAEALLVQFSGKGLVADVIASSAEFVTGVAAGAAFTVFLATCLGRRFPPHMPLLAD